MLEPIAEMQHFTTNIELDIDGDTAEGKSYTLNVNGLRDGKGQLQHMIVGAQYIDRYCAHRQGLANQLPARGAAVQSAFGHQFGLRR